MYAHVYYMTQSLSRVYDDGDSVGVDNYTDCRSKAILQRLLPQW